MEDAEGRVAELEALVEELNNKIDSLEWERDDLEGEVEGLRDEIADLQEGMEGVASQDIREGQDAIYALREVREFFDLPWYTPIDETATAIEKTLKKHGVKVDFLGLS